MTVDLQVAAGETDTLLTPLLLPYLDACEKGEGGAAEWQSR